MRNPDHARRRSIPRTPRRSGKVESQEGIIDFTAMPKWGTPEHAAAEAAFYKEQGPMLPAMPIISDAEFYRLQDLAAKYRR